MKRIIQQPRAGIVRGFSQLGAVMAATLGPKRGVIWHANGSGKPEALSDSGVIARRVTQLSGAAENLGAQILRGAVMQMHERYLDGGALTATLARALVEEAYRALAAGGDPMLLRGGIERGIAAANAAIHAAAQPVSGQTALEQVALTATEDEELARILGEMFDLLGRHGAYVVDEYAAPLLDREYVAGGRWSARPASRDLMPLDDLVLERPLIFACADKLERFDQIRPALEAAMYAPEPTPLLIVARDLVGEALQAVTLNHARGRALLGAAILLTTGDALRADLEDVSLLVGGQLAAGERGTAPEFARPGWLGRARQIILKRDSLTIIDGAGDPALRQRRVGELRTQARAISTFDEAWERLRLRIARLSGGMGVLKVGALTFQERDERKARAKKAARALETALESGSVPGGGVAYLNAIPCVQALNDPGATLVARALRAPFLQLVTNSGAESPQVALNAALKRGGDFGFDARTRELRSLVDIRDSAAVLSAALQTAGSAAIMALTTDVLIVET